MTRDWETQFGDWAKPPGKTEEDRCNNAVSAIRNAIKASALLRDRDVSIFAQGSYRNNTNVRQDSDVDIGIVCGTTYLNDYPEGTTRETFGFSASDYRYAQFKNEVETALVEYFGRAAVTRGNKAFDIHETSYHVEADVAPFFTHRRYSIDGKYHEGVALLPDNGSGRIENWPEQHYANGCQKNNDTGTRFKSIVRVLKALSSEMAEQGVSGGDIPGFLIECLVWNVPDPQFQNNTYAADVKAALVEIYQRTQSDETCKEWVEVSRLKWLIRPWQKWTRQQANAFTVAVWNYAELKGQT
jgi:predicted nucleotidyltransferase